MAITKRIPRSMPMLTMAVQDLNVRHRFPGFSCRRIGAQTIWRGTLQPREVSPSYRVEVRYKLGRYPTVKVLRPALAPGTPHLYAGGILCLYWPDEWVWRSDELVAETIIPWTSLWLFYYELWLDTGDWLGPSSHGSPPKNKHEGIHGA